MAINYTLLKKISYRYNVILIEFNENMNRSGRYSFANPDNYGFEVNESIIPFPNTTEVLTNINGPSVRMKLPQSYSSYIVPNTKVHLGYTALKTVKYIKNSIGIVHNLCVPAILGSMIPDLNISNGTCRVQNDHILEYIYSGENILYDIDIEDFYVDINGNIIKPIDLIKDENKVLFQFPQNTFITYRGAGKLKVVSTPKSLDIYGFNIVGNVSVAIINNIPTEILTASIVNEAVDKIYLKLLFESPLINFYDGDFLASFNNKLYSIKTQSIDVSRKVVTVSVDIPYAVNTPLKIFTAVPIELVQTIDIYGAKVYDVDGVYSETFMASFPIWNSTNNNLSDNIIELKYERNIRPESIIVDKDFNGTFIPWDGSDLTVPVGALNILHGSTYDEMRLKNNESFGTIKIYSKAGFNFITKNVINTENCVIHKEDNKIYIFFSHDEKADVSMSAIDRFYYSPSEFIESETEHFIFYGYEPKGRLIFLTDTIYVLPINDANDNPFKGGYYNFNYVLQVDDNHTYRDYGIDSSQSIVQGFIKVVGNLSLGQIIRLNNLDVRVCIILDVKYGSIKINKVITPLMRVI